MKFFAGAVSLLLCLSLHAQAWLWARGGDPASISEGYAVATDASGNVFVTGYFQNSAITFGSYTLPNTGFADAYLTKYDASGNVIWARSAGGIDFDMGTSVATDAAGNIYWTGCFQSASITIGTYTLTNTLSGDLDIFIVKFNAAGNVVWAKSAGGTGTDYGYGIATDHSGNIYLAGSFTSPSINLGSFTLNNTASVSSLEMFLIKYDAAGNVVWAKSEGGVNNEEAYAVATDVAGNIFVTGYFTTPTFNFGTFTLTNADNTGNSPDVFIAKFNPSGTVLWAKDAGGTGQDYGFGIAADISGNIYSTGGFGSSGITFGSTTLTNMAVGNFDCFIVKYDNNGNVIWVKNGTGGNTDAGYSVAIDNSQNVYVVGSFTSLTVAFDALNLNYPVGGTDPLFIVKFDPAGNVLCGSALMSGGDDRSSVATDGVGDAYVGGDFEPASFVVGADTLSLTNSTYETVFVAKYTCDSTAIEPSPLPNECNTIYVPSAFSPNGDGQNDVLFVRSPCISQMDFVIYDRWGEKVFETTDITKGWDGTLHGEKSSNAVFIYCVTATFTNGKTGFAKGNVSLIK